MPSRALAVPFAVAAVAALSLAACDSSTPTPTATSPQLPLTVGASQQVGRSDRNGPPFVESLNGLTGDVRLIAGQNVAITSDADARTITLGVSAQSSTPVIHIVKQIGAIPAGMMNSAVAITCFPAGSKVISGGFALGSAAAQVYASYPNKSAAFGERWIVQAANPTAAPVAFDVYAVCVS